MSAAAINPDRNFKYWIIAPAVFLMLAVGLFPLIYSLIVSFMRIDMMDTDTSFAGLYNYKNLFQDLRLWQSLLHTLIKSHADHPPQRFTMPLEQLVDSVAIASLCGQQ